MLTLVGVQLRKLKNNLKDYYRPRISKSEWDLIKENRCRNEYTYRNVLVIGDLHEPFCLDGYLEHCIDTYERFNCTDTVLIGEMKDGTPFHMDRYAHEADGVVLVNRIKPHTSFQFRPLSKKNNWRYVRFGAEVVSSSKLP